MTEEIEIKWNKTPYSFREYVMLGIILVLMIAFALTIYAEKKTIESYQKPYNECQTKLGYYINGYATLNENKLNITPISTEYK